MANVAINGMGRIGRAALKILMDADGLDLVAVNDLAQADNLAYLLKYDSVYGRYHREVSAAEDALVVDGHRISALTERDPANLPWDELGVDLVLECTGAFTTAEDLETHIQAGASYVILSAPTTSETVPTVVHGVNRPDGRPQVISCASCTTNCIGPVIEVAHRRLAVERAVMTTVHAYTAGQRLVDGPSRSFRRGRAGAANLVPTSTGAARATTRAVPELAERFDGIAVRAPVPVGSIADVVFVTSHPTTSAQVNDAYRQEAATTRYEDILGVSEDPLVSADIIGDRRAAVIDLELTRVVDGTLVKVMAWYDNEWGFTHQMIREASSILAQSRDAHRAALRTERAREARRVLVVTNEDLADADEVPEPLRPLIDDAEEIYVVAPTLTTWMQWLADDRDRALVAADERLRTVFEHMRSDGLKPHGEVGAENQVIAIEDALAEFDADLIVLRLHAPGSEHENWREHRIAEKVRSHFDTPTVVFYFDNEGHVVGRDEA